MGQALAVRDGGARSKGQLKSLEEGMRSIKGSELEKGSGITKQRQKWDAMAFIPKFRWI